MTRLLDEISDTQQFLLTFYGNKLALGFRGTPSFIERSFNLAYNTGMTNGQLHWLANGTNQRRALGYVVIGSKRKDDGGIMSPDERLTRGLETHFYQELIGTGDVQPLNEPMCSDYDSDIEPPIYDEVELEKRAAQMAKDFKARIVSECFLEPPDKSLAPVYGAPMAELAVRGSFAPESYDA